MAETPPSSSSTEESNIIQQGTDAAIRQTLEPAATERAYPGHFTIVADGSWFGHDNTWPGLDSWQMAGAYLLLGRTRLVLDYFEFVQLSQRADGNIPYAIISADSPPEHLKTYNRGMRYPDDVFTYDPKLENYMARKWIGTFSHWIAQINPLGALAAVSYILLGHEIYSAMGDQDWLTAKLPSLELAAHYLRSRKSENGLVAGAGFYTEMPPRHQWDGVAQCYVVHALRKCAELNLALGRTAAASNWKVRAETVAMRFRETFWRGDHFAEYLHPDRGIVDSHGLSDVNWAAVAFDVATPAQADAVWPKLMGEPAFWHGGMPTQTVSKPFAYEEWEYFSSHEDVGFTVPVGPLYDVAAMGRVWFLECQACVKRGETKRLRESAMKVCQRGLKDGGFWHERYHPLPDGTVDCTGPKGYGEYPAILVRAVFGNPTMFPDLDFPALKNIPWREIKRR